MGSLLTFVASSSKVARQPKAEMAVTHVGGKRKFATIANSNDSVCVSGPWRMS